MNETRSIEGAAASFIVCSLASVLGVWLCPTLAFTNASIELLAVFWVVYALLETVSPHEWDNLLIQLVPTWIAALLFGKIT